VQGFELSKIYFYPGDAGSTRALLFVLESTAIKMKIDAVIATYNREDCIVDAVNSLLQYQDDMGVIYVVINGSTDKTMERLSVFSDEDKVILIEIDKNLGAPGGKNIGMRRSDADVLVIIDDDAEFFSDEPIKLIDEIFSADPVLGIIQFKIVNYAQKHIMNNEFPGKDVATQGDSEFKIGSYTGAGHAIRKNMLESVGYYQDSFFYGHEELDLSFRAIQGGWSIWYKPSIGVYHKKNPGGRLPKREMIVNMLLNRMIISRKYLPLKYRVVSTVLWCSKVALWSRSIVVPLLAIREYLKLRHNIERFQLSAEALNYMKHNYGRLWY